MISSGGIFAGALGKFPLVRERDFNLVETQGARAGRIALIISPPSDRNRAGSFGRSMGNRRSLGALIIFPSGHDIVARRQIREIDCFRKEQEPPRRGRRKDGSLRKDDVQFVAIATIENVRAADETRGEDAGQRERENERVILESADSAAPRISTYVARF